MSTPHPTFPLVSGLIATALLAVAPSRAALPSASPARMIAVAWNDAKGGSGHVDLMHAETPWNFSGNPLETGRNAVLRVVESRIYAVCPGLDAIKTFTLNPWALERTYNLPRGADPVDIAVVDSQTAYVTGRRATHLLRLDLVTGDTADSVDLSAFADADGIPDLGDMALHEGRLFIQIRRLNELFPGGYVPPAYLAVMDIAGSSLIDTDPVFPGLQPIRLAGEFPKRPMQILPSIRRLFLSATGGFFDSGGIEMIDLDSLHSLGLVIPESDGLTGADLGPFYIVEPDRGYLVFTTDLTISSHLTPFSLLSGVSNVNLHTEVDFLAPVLEYDAASDSLFFPSSGFVKPGIHVFDASSGLRLTTNAIPTEGPPTDLALVGNLSDPPNPASLEIALHPCLEITGSTGARYEIQYVSDLGSTNWMTLTNVTLRKSPTLWCDPDSVTHQARRFYRAVAIE